MNILEKELSNFAEANLATFKTSEMDLNRDNAINYLKNEIKNELNDLNDNEIKKQRANFFNIGQPDDYQEHIVDIGDNKMLICGIRYIGCDLNYPFVKITANFQISNKKEAKELYEIVKSRFSIFSPKFVSFYTAQKFEADRFGYVYMVAPFDKINSSSAWENDGKVKLKKITNDSYYDWYCQGYDEFHIERPDLKGRVQVNSKEKMNESLEQGLLYYALIKNEKVGLISGVKSDFLGHKGLYFNEILVRKEWKGNSLAKIIQQKMIKEAGSFSDFVWGTIDFRNQPSLRTALSNGRRPVRYENFIEV